MSTNYPEHPQSAIFTAPSSGNRPLAAAIINADDRQPSGHLIRIARHYFSLRSLPSQLLAEHVAGGSDSPSLPPAFHQSRQDNRVDVSKNFPIRIQVSGRRTAIRCASFNHTSPVKGPLFSISLLISRVIHELESLMEKGGNHGKAFGVFGNERRTASVRNPSEAHCAGGPLPVGGRAHSARF
jgi:hypothetical protein